MSKYTKLKMKLKLKISSLIRRVNIMIIIRLLTTRSKDNMGTFIHFGWFKYLLATTIGSQLKSLDHMTIANESKLSDARLVAHMTITWSF